MDQCSLIMHWARRADSSRIAGATLVDVGQSGHMGNAANLGLWPTGLVHFGAFLATLSRRA